MSATAGAPSALRASAATDSRPLLVHVVYRFDVGGLENGLVNLINHMPADAYRHTVVALTEIAPAFSQRVQRDDVGFVSLRKPPGQGFWQYPRLWRLFRELKPALVHTRNIAALECQVPAFVAGVPARVHSEHGRELLEIGTKRSRYGMLRRLYRPLVHHQVALSRDLADYLGNECGVGSDRLSQIYNGVDTQQFRPAEAGRVPIPGCPFMDPRQWLIGTVGRMQSIKAQTDLAHAFIRMLARQPALASHARLVMIGDGPLRAASRTLLDEAGVGHLAWLPGERDDVSNIMRGLNCFALPSLSEGISNTILEAMASGLPVVATDVGGNADLVANGRSGELVPAGDIDAMAASLMRMANGPQRAMAMGAEGRKLVEQRFSLTAMVDAYQGVYDRLLRRTNP